MEISWSQIIITSLILIFLCLCGTSKNFKYYYKLFLFYGGISIVTVWCVPLMMIQPRRAENFAIASKYTRCLDNLLGLTWEIRGIEHVEKEQACIIIANHQTSLDVLGILRIWPKNHKCSVVIKKEILYFGLIGVAGWLSRLVFIDRMNSESAKITMNKAIDNIKKEKIKLWIFPEGTRHNDGKVHGFKKGAFHIAINYQLPIIPIVFSSHDFWSPEQKRFDEARIIATILPRISTEGLGPNDLDSLVAKTQNAMSEVFDSMKNEIR